MNNKPSVYEAMRNGLVRTYGDLIRVCRPSSERGNCCACHKWGRQTWQLSTRASICRECCERKANETLGRIATAERKARHYAREMIKRNADFEKEARFYAGLAGVSEAFMKEAYTSARAKSPVQLSE